MSCSDVSLDCVFPIVVESQPVSGAPVPNFFCLARPCPCLALGRKPDCRAFATWEKKARAHSYAADNARGARFKMTRIHTPLDRDRLPVELAMQPHSLATFKPLLSQLVQSLPVPPPPTGQLRDPAEPLSQEQLEALLEHLSDVTFTQDPANSAAIGSALTALRLSGLDMRPSTLAFMRQKFIEQIQPFDVPVLEDSPNTDYRGWVDIVGTGGDGKDTFNVSTTAMFIAGGVNGMHVAKHGGKASTSPSGSGELLMSLGLPLLQVPSDEMVKSLFHCSCTFLFAPMFHRAMMPLAPIRASLGFPTLFNILGPLINPKSTCRGLYGVHSSGLGRIYAETLYMSGLEYFWVVCGEEGLDELSPAGQSYVWEVSTRGKIDHFTVTPADFGLPSHTLEEVRSGTPSQNAAMLAYMFLHPDKIEDAPLKEPLHVECDIAHVQLDPIPAGTNLKAIYDYSVLQAAALLYIAGHGQGDLKECTHIAQASIQDGRALAAWRRLHEFMHSVKSL